MPHLLPLRRWRALLPLLLTLQLVLTGAAAQSHTNAPVAAPGPEPTLHLLRPYQVWLDELPPTLSADDVEVVVLQPDARCNPPEVKALGFLRTRLITPINAAYCKRLQAYVDKPPAPLPFTLRLHTADLPLRQPAAIVAALQPAPQRRYVALVHWQGIEGPQWQWAFEEAVVDRSSGRWVWHAARGHGTSTLRDWAERTELQALASVFQHELPRDLLDRGWWQRHVPVEGSRWVSPAEMAGWQPGTRAGLAVVNSFVDNPRMDSLRSLALWPDGTAEIPALRVDLAAHRTVQRPQFAPLLPTGTHALLDLPAGSYRMRIYGDAQPLVLEPGRITVLKIQRGWTGNTPVVAAESFDGWRTLTSEGNSRHAFLAEPVARGGAFVPYFLP